jgi:hypothetical protein
MGTASSDGRPWSPIETEIGTIWVSPLNLITMNVVSEHVVVNRVDYKLYGPLYRLGTGEWSAYEEDKWRDHDPNFTLLRHDDTQRQGSHAAYRKSVEVIEAAVRAWMPVEEEFARLTVASIESLLAGEVVTLAEWYSDPESMERFPSLLQIREDYSAKLGEQLEEAKFLAGGGKRGS